MTRVHAVEIHELETCPGDLRDGLTDVLQFGMTAMRLDAAVAGPIASALRRAGTTTVIDLCSGGTGPWLALRGRLAAAVGAEVDVRLTDRFPSLTGQRRVAEAGDAHLAYLDTPVDATAVPRGLRGFRTLFNAFHQFQPGEAEAILRDAVRAGEGIAVVETLSRSPRDLIHSAVLPLLVPVLALVARPWSWGRAFWTFVVPVLPFAIGFDAVVSCLRTYDRRELQALVDRLGDTGYTWEFGSAWMVPGVARAHWLIGVPQDAARRLD